MAWYVVPFHWSLTVNRRKNTHIGENVEGENAPQTLDNKVGHTIKADGKEKTVHYNKSGRDSTASNNHTLAGAITRRKKS